MACAIRYALTNRVPRPASAREIAETVSPDVAAMTDNGVPNLYLGGMNVRLMRARYHNAYRPVN